MGFGKSARNVGYMQQRLLADDGIVACVCQRQVHHIAFQHAHFAVEPDAPRQFRSAGDAGRRQLDAGDVGAIAMGQISCRPAEPGAEIDHLAVDADPRGLRQRVVGGKSAIVILVVGKQILGLQPLEGAARRLEFCEDDLRRDRMAMIEVDGRSNPGSHWSHLKRRLTIPIFRRSARRSGGFRIAP